MTSSLTLHFRHTLPPPRCAPGSRRHGDDTESEPTVAVVPCDAILLRGTLLCTFVVFFNLIFYALYPLAPLIQPIEVATSPALTLIIKYILLHPTTHALSNPFSTLQHMPSLTPSPPYNTCPL
jgi:hypothetical protein